MGVVEILLRVVFANLIYPMVLELVRKRELDPAFKAESDKVYGDLKVATTTAERKALARRLYELQKNS